MTMVCACVSAHANAEVVSMGMVSHALAVLEMLRLCQARYIFQVVFVMQALIGMMPSA